jgi:hypothetical protein
MVVVVYCENRARKEISVPIHDIRRKKGPKIKRLKAEKEVPAPKVLAAVSLQPSSIFASGREKPLSSPI